MINLLIIESNCEIMWLNMKKLFVFSLALLFLNSCAIYGLTNDYGKLSEEQKALISPLESFENLENNKIYTLNGQRLKEEIQKYPKALVYVFTNDCTSEYCLPMAVYKGYANENGYKLFLVMNGYANIDDTLDQYAEVPYFAIDNEYYDISMRNKYIRYFTNELTGLPRDAKQKEYLGDLYFFENGELQSISRELPNIKKAQNE